MKYQQIIPGERLRPYVKCYYIFESQTKVEVNDTVFPGGDMEIIFNLGEGIWQSSINDVFCTTPQVELWGKLTQPLDIKSVGKNTMLGIKFYPHSAAYFLNDEAREFNNQVSDLKDLLGASVRILHSKLREVQQLEKRIELIEDFLLSRLASKEKRMDNITMIGRVVKEMQKTDTPDYIDAIAVRYNISSRYLGKLFLQYTGVTPKLYNKINRFQQSLQLVTENKLSLTSIAYECGYFDQSHFIRDFKFFTGFTPSAYTPASYPVSQVLSSN